jgi:hypothetical protein
MLGWPRGGIKLNSQNKELPKETIVDLIKDSISIAICLSENKTTFFDLWNMERTRVKFKFQGIEYHQTIWNGVKSGIFLQLFGARIGIVHANDKLII